MVRDGDPSLLCGEKEMADELFYLIAQKSFGQPLIGECLFGEYCGGTDSRSFGTEFPENEVALISKNIKRIPKIFGELDWIVSSELRAILEPFIVAKWREVKIAEPFLFDTRNKNGFQLHEELLRQQMRECLASGKSGRECNFEQTTDPGLAYLDVVKRYAVSDFQSPDIFFELIAVSSTAQAKQDQNADMVEIDNEHSPPIFSRITPKSKRFFSPSALESFGLMKLGNRCCALTQRVFEVVKPFVEPDLYTIVAIEKASLDELR